MNDSALPDLSAHELQAVCAIADYRSFNAAALTLGVSQSALTRTLKRVERLLGTELFRRSTRKVEPTPAGREFVAVATRVLYDLRSSYAALHALSGEQRGRVVISSVMSVTSTRLPALVAGHRAAHPGIEIHLREGVHGSVIDDVRNGVADFGITYVDELPNDFDGRPLGREAFCVVMPHGHPLAARRKLALHQLDGVPLVSLPLESQTRRTLDAFASVNGLTLRPAVTVTQFATALRCVEAGIGLCVLPQGALPSASTSPLVARPLISPKLARTLGLVTLRGRPAAPGARRLLDDLDAHWHGRLKTPRA